MEDTISPEISNEMRDRLVSPSQQQTFEQSQTVRGYGSQIRRHRVAKPVSGGKKATSGFKPVGGQSLDLCVPLRDLGALTGNVHDTARRDIPRLKARLRRT